MKNAILICCMILCAAGANAQWVQTNGPVGGQATNVIRLQGHLFVNGSNGGNGGFFRSDDDGETWTTINNGLPSHTCYVMKSDGQNLFAAIYGEGIYKSSDLGATWKFLGLHGQTFYALAVVGNDIYAGSSEGGIYYSGNDGTTWTFRNNEFQGDQVRDFVFLQNTLFVASNSGIYKSSNKGETLTKLDNGSANFFTGSGTNLYTSLPGLYISRNLGETWPGTFPDGNVTSVYADNDDVAAAGYFKFFRSGNAGISWTTYDNPGYTGRISSVYTENDKVFAAGDEGFFASSNFGATWAPKNSGLRNVIVQHLGASATNLFAGTEKGIFTSADNGNNWSKVNNGLIDNTGINQFVGVQIKGIHAGPGAVFTATTRGVYKLAGNGQMWTSVLDVADNAVTSMAGNGGRMFVHAGANQYYSAEEGANWTMRSEPSIQDAYSHSVVKGDTIVIFGPEKVYLSKNFGETWKDVPIKSGFYFPTSALILDDMIMMSSYQGLYVYSFANNTWTKRSLGIPDEVRSLARVGDAIYAGTSQGVFVSYNAGVSWYVTGTSKREYDVLAANDTYLFGGTYGESVWKSTLGDLNIKPVITAYAGVTNIERDKSITISLSDLTISDPDTDPADFVLTIHPSTNYTVNGNAIVPGEGFFGELDVTISVSDGHSSSKDFVIKIGVIVGLEDEPFVARIYPNPVSKKLYVRSTRMREYKIKDTMGREILRGVISNNAMECEIDVSTIASGLYFIEVYGNDKRVTRFTKAGD